MSDYSDSDSDIESMFKAAQAKSTRRRFPGNSSQGASTPPPLSSNNNDKCSKTNGVVDDESSGSCNSLSDEDAIRTSTKKRRVGRPKSVEDRLAQINQQKCIRDLQRRRALARKDDDDSDDDDDDNEAGLAHPFRDKNALKVQVEVRTLGEEKQESTSSSKLITSQVVGMLDDEDVMLSSDEEAILTAPATQRPTRALPSSAKNQGEKFVHNAVEKQPPNPSASKRTLEQISRYRKAAEALRGAQNCETLDVQLHENDEDCLIIDDDDDDCIRNKFRGALLRITVNSKVKKIGSDEVATKVLSIDAHENDTVPDLVIQYKKAMNLKPSTAVTMKFGGLALSLNNTRRTLQSYGIQKNASVDATAILSGLSNDTIGNTGTGGVRTVAPKDLGKPLKLTLRRQDGKKVRSNVLELRTKEAFKVLVDKYRASQDDLGASSTSSVRLMFDGQPLGMTATPLSVDMEDEDMIDVIIQ